ncbi:MAG: rhodanese-like domain-containing protein [Bacteroidota bacterium]|nr:rhodanese-like domain-containing protein [Bacteroidota bacterium]
MKRIIVFCWLVMACFMVNGQTSEIVSLKPVEFSSWLKKSNNVQLVDVRTSEEFGTGHLRNAQNMDLKSDDFKKMILRLDKKRPVLVYCRSGKRSMKAAEILKNEGFVKIINLEGGILEWENSGFPLERKR